MRELVLNSDELTAEQVLLSTLKKLAQEPALVGLLSKVRRLIDPIECRKVTDKHPDYFTFDVEKWLANADNYALIEGDNIAFGEYKSPGVYWVHFCFDTARGREAIQLTKDMFKEFCRACPVKTAIGLIELKNKKARWLIRQVGFKSLGEVMTENGMCEMFYSTKEG